MDGGGADGLTGTAGTSGESAALGVSAGTGAGAAGVGAGSGDPSMRWIRETYRTFMITTGSMRANSGSLWRTSSASVIGTNMRVDRSR